MGIVCWKETRRAPFHSRSAEGHRCRSIPVIALLATSLGACNDPSAAPGDAAFFVHNAALVDIELVQLVDGQTVLTLTGEVQARFSAYWSFRLSGTRSTTCGRRRPRHAGDELATT